MPDTLCTHFVQSTSSCRLPWHRWHSVHRRENFSSKAAKWDIYCSKRGSEVHIATGRQERGLPQGRHEWWNTWCPQEMQTAHLSHLLLVDCWLVNFAVLADGSLYRAAQVVEQFNVKQNTTAFDHTQRHALSTYETRVTSKELIFFPRQGLEVGGLCTCMLKRVSTRICTFTNAELLHEIVEICRVIVHLLLRWWPLSDQPKGVSPLIQTVWYKTLSAVISSYLYHCMCIEQL